jgi:CheY-like chemotaxis protein
VEKPFVLLADDNEGTCTLIRALLRPEFDVDVAIDGLDAIERLRARHYSAILIDLLMPVTDGYAVLDFLKEEHPDLLSRVLVITAAVSPRELARVHAYAICGVIAKPFDIDALLTTVRQCAGVDPAPPLRGPLLSSGMLLLLADFLRQKWL